MPEIRNPVLPGFHPDPSILRVGDDYYLATSTFEWYPGVRLHHSRDLVHWRPIGGILTERRLLDLTGVPDSGGVWAPCLSYHDGLFYLVYTNVLSYAGGYKDTLNYVITAPAPDGPWSDPVPLHARGFDASMYHEDDTSWLLNMTIDPPPDGRPFAGIQAQRYDRERRTLVGEPIDIFTGTDIGVTEGPHLYKRDGWYYLMAAEGGTGYAHGITVARSRALTGPYQVDPAGPLLTARDRPDLPLQKTGHGCLVETQGGEWYLAYLVGRPYTERGRCVLGRETAIQQCFWSADGWLRMAGGVPALSTPAPNLPPAPVPQPAVVDDFDTPELGPDWSTLRRPAEGWADLTARPGYLRVHGGQTPLSRIAPSLVARRVTARSLTFGAAMDYRPTSVRTMAGITAYYNTHNWHYLHVTVDRDGRTLLRLLTYDRRRFRSPEESTVDISGYAGPDGTVRIELRLDLSGPTAHAGYRLPGGGWVTLPTDLDVTILSDEYADEKYDGVIHAFGFTGAFVGLWAHDQDRQTTYADFDHASYLVHDKQDEVADS